MKHLASQGRSVLSVLRGCSLTSLRSVGAEREARSGEERPEIEVWHNGRRLRTLHTRASPLELEHSSSGPSQKLGERSV